MSKKPPLTPVIDHPDYDAEPPIVVTRHHTGSAPCLSWDRYAPGGSAPAIAEIPPLIAEVPPLILVHGASHSAAIYQYWGCYLADLGITVYAVDLRGHGHSSLPPGQPMRRVSLTDYVADVRQVVQALGLTEGQSVLAGHSLGGGVAQLYARRYPIAGLSILASTTLHRFLAGTFPLAWHAPLVYAQAMLHGPRALFNSSAKVRALLLDSDASEVEVEMVYAQMGDETSGTLAASLQYLVQGVQPLRTAQVQVVGAGRDSCFSRRSVERCARDYATEAQFVEEAPHDLMVGRRWQEAADLLAMFVYHCTPLHVPTSAFPLPRDVAP